MADIIIRPTIKFVYLGYFVVIVIIVGWVALAMRLQWPTWVPPALQPWIPWAPVLLLLWPTRRYLHNRLTKTTISDFQLRYESGLLSKTTRTLMLPRVQDVTVHQRLGQRIFNVGDVSIETAGEAGRLTIFQIDQPQTIADIINERSQNRSPTDPTA